MCFTNDPGPRIAAILAPFQAVADEILVVADSRVPESDLRDYESVADRLVLYEYIPPVERPLAWAHRLCAGNWVFRIDGDEIASPDLVAALPVLCQERGALQFWTPRRWLFPDSRTWLDEPPWHPDYQVRLVRNDPAIPIFRGVGHTSAELRLPAKWLSEPLYHLDALVKPFASRLSQLKLTSMNPSCQGWLRTAAVDRTTSSICQSFIRMVDSEGFLILILGQLKPSFRLQGPG